MTEYQMGGGIHEPPPCRMYWSKQARNSLRAGSSRPRKQKGVRDTVEDGRRIVDEAASRHASVLEVATPEGQHEGGKLHRCAVLKRGWRYIAKAPFQWHRSPAEG